MCVSFSFRINGSRGNMQISAKAWNNRGHRNQNNSGSQKLCSDSRKYPKNWRKFQYNSINFSPFLNIHRMASFHQFLELLFLVYSELYWLFVGYRKRCWHSRASGDVTRGQIQNGQANAYPTRVIKHKGISYSINI